MRAISFGNLIVNKRPIDHARDAAISMNIGDDGDSSPLREIISATGRLLIIKERGIWQIKLADDVDPDRTNPDIPHSQQKLLPRGTLDPLVCRTLLQAKRLLNSDYLPNTCDTDAGLQASLTFLHEVSALQDKADEFKGLTARLSETFDATSPRGEGLNIPAMGDVEARGKAFIQTADHAVRSLWQLVRALEPDLPARVSWSRFRARLEEGDDRSRQVVSVVEQLLIGFTFLRNTRNAVEHPKPGQEVVFEDYRLKADGYVHPPAITVIEVDTPLSETELGAYFGWVITFLVNAFEAVLVNLCAVHVELVGGFEVVVTKLEPDQRRYPDVAYCYASWMGNELVLHLE